MGKQGRKGKARVAPHTHHKAGEGSHPHHKLHEGPLYQQYHHHPPHHNDPHNPHNGHTNGTTPTEEAKTEPPSTPPAMKPPTTAMVVTPEAVVEDEAKTIDEDDAMIDDILQKVDDVMTDEDERLIHELLDDFGVTNVPPEVLRAKPSPSSKPDDNTSNNSSIPNNVSLESISNDENDKTPVFLADLDDTTDHPVVLDEILAPPPAAAAAAATPVDATPNDGEPTGAAKPRRNSTKTFSNRVSAAAAAAAAATNGPTDASASLANNQQASQQQQHRQKPTSTEPFNLSSSNTFRLSHLEEPHESDTKFKARPLPKTTHQPQQIKDIPPVESTTSSFKMSRMRYSGAPKLSTAARSKDREERAKQFREAAERSRKERERKLKLHKKKLEEQRKQKEDLKAKRAAEYQARDANKGVVNPSSSSSRQGPNGTRLTVCHPFALRSTALHEQSVARIEQRRKMEEEKKQSRQQKSQFKPRPVPPTTYHSNRISTHESDTEWSRLYHKRRHEKLEELKRKEEEKKREEEEERSFHSRKVPATTYKSPSKFNESLRHVSPMRQSRMEEIRKKEAEKDDGYHKFRARPVPKTTYKPSPVSVRDIHLVEELQACHSQDQNEAPEFEFHARPVPDTTYHPQSVSASSAKKKSNSSSKEPTVCVSKALTTRKKSERSIPAGDSKAPPVRVYKAQSASHTTFHARPVPSSTYNPTWISPKQSSKKLPSSSSTVVSGRSTTSSKTARSSSTFKSWPRLKKETASSSARIAETRQRSSEASVGSASSKSFKARPVPKTTYQPVSTRLTEPHRPVAKKTTEPKKKAQGATATAKPQKDMINKVPKAVQKPTTSFTPVTNARPASDKAAPKQSPRKLPSPRKLNASLAAESQPSFEPDKAKNSYAPSCKSAYTQEQPSSAAESGIYATTVAVGTIPMTEDNEMEIANDHAEELANLLDKEPSAEITFGGWENDDDALDAILDQGLTGEITAEIEFNQVSDDDSANDQELSAILGGEPLKTTVNHQDQHDAELNAILNF